MNSSQINEIKYVFGVMLAEQTKSKDDDERILKIKFQIYF
jgi:hypothetical protein